jgi:hypothetical protein
VTANNVAASNTTKSLINNTQYDFLKALAQYVLPAAGVLYYALSGFWGFPHPMEVVGTITAVDTFLGVVLGALKKQYLGSADAFDGTLHLDGTDPNAVVLSKLVVDTPGNMLAGQDSVTLKVQNAAG